jgi:hypothetical protein
MILKTILGLEGNWNELKREWPKRKARMSLPWLVLNAAHELALFLLIDAVEEGIVTRFEFFSLGGCSFECFAAKHGECIDGGASR